MAKTPQAGAPVDANLQIERWPIGRLVPRALNPRPHSDQQIAQVAASIRVVMEPVVPLAAPAFLPGSPICCRETPALRYQENHP
jgi:hypothetical protein